LRFSNRARPGVFGEITYATLDKLGLCGILGVLLAYVPLAPAAEPSAAKTAGSVAVAPQIADLESGWTERKIVFAVDPLDEPSENVNEAASRDPSNRQRLLAQVRKEMQEQGSVGIGYFGYGYGNLVHAQGRYDLYISRYPDSKSLERQWSHYARQKDSHPDPGLGDAAVWVERKGADHDYRLVLRKGLFLARFECTAKEAPERLVHLAKTLARNIDQATEPDNVDRDSGMAATPVANINPTPEILGTGWRSKVEVLMDPSGTTSEIVGNDQFSPETVEAWRRSARDPQHALSGWARTRFEYVSASATNAYYVQIDRYRGREALKKEFGRLQTRKAAPALQSPRKIGEAAVVRHEQGAVTLWFRRGLFIVTVSSLGATPSLEGEGASMWSLAQLVDRNIIEAGRGSKYVIPREN
jgi:hypothetical protein